MGNGTSGQILLLLAATLLSGACATQVHEPLAPTSKSKDSTMTTPDPKSQVAALIASIESGDHAPIAFIDPNHYTQHNLGAADGLAGFGELMKQLPPGSARARPVRVFQDGPFVFAHTEYDFFGPKIGFDVFRFEDGKIVEHWDNLQETPKAANPSGHTMTDGPTDVRRPGSTEASKALVAAFLDDVLVHGRTRSPATSTATTTSSTTPPSRTACRASARLSQTWRSTA
jgi:predicted SnoaL-like aldol condensation-catalyzing enzyme